MWVFWKVCCRPLIDWLICGLVVCSWKAGVIWSLFSKIIFQQNSNAFTRKHQADVILYFVTFYFSGGRWPRSSCARWKCRRSHRLCNFFRWNWFYLHWSSLSCTEWCDCHILYCCDCLILYCCDCLILSISCTVKIIIVLYCFYYHVWYCCDCHVLIMIILGIEINYLTSELTFKVNALKFWPIFTSIWSPCIKKWDFC